LHGQALIDLGAAGSPPTPASAAVWLFPINKEKTAMTNATLQRWPVILALCLIAMVIDHGAAKAQAQDGTDLSIELVDPKVLRVCADPRNLPFSNEKGDGFENKLAELFAEKLQKKLDYMFFPQATGFVRMTLGAHRCDVIMGFPQGDDLVQGTNPYYRTAYALVAKPGSGLDDVTTLGDERLKGKHLGIVAGTPPATNMAVNGLMTDAKPYPLMIDTRIDSSAAAMIQDLTAGVIDAGVLWGPMAGYYAKQSNPPLHVMPLVKETSGPRLAYRIGMGVRGADQNWKRLLNRLIQENQQAINKILLDYGVPLLDENDRPITAETAAKQP
jgi:quinoprotein dehydrogenase-associated probable ABC transporter substrate-binding protein